MESHWWKEPKGSKSQKVKVPAEYEIVPVELLAYRKELEDKALAESEMRMLHAVVWVD